MRNAMSLFALAILLTTGCSSISNTVSNATGSGSADSDIENAIKANLASVPAIRDSNLSVAASAAKNEVTLSGTVPTEELRLKAIQLTKSARPDLLVTDKINVKPPEIVRSNYTDGMANDARVKAKELGNKIGASLDDAWIYTQIMARLAADPDASALKVNVDVAHKTVTLRGQVQTATAKAEAERIVKETPGVTSLSNLVRVVPA